MRVEQEKVREFMEKIGDVTHATPTVVEPPVAERRYRLIREELKEYRDAAFAGDLVGVADALGDLLYTVLGLAVLHGIDARSIFEEVHRSNMTKEPLAADDPIRASSFKLCRKGDTFSAARIAEILFLQVHNELPDVLR
jgi:predicted HAD superfamily Cof-like phosphohydrolase